MHVKIPLPEFQDQFIASQRARNHSENTVAHYKSTFKDFERFLTATQRSSDSGNLTTPTLRAFSEWLRATPTRPWRGSTQRSIHGTHARLRDMRAFTRWLVAEELLDRGPKVDLPKLPSDEFPVLSDADIQKLFACPHLSSGGDQSIRNRALISLMLDTGLRRTETSTVELKDLDLHDQLILVRGKGNKQRRVPFSSGVLELLKDWLTIRGDETGPLFWLTSSGIYSLFHRIQRDTGILIHPHKLRHQAASIMVRNNADLHSIKRVLGHASVTTTERYVTQSYADLRAKHAAASPFETVRAAMPEQTQKPRRKRLTL